MFAATTEPCRPAPAHGRNPLIRSTSEGAASAAHRHRFISGLLQGTEPVTPSAFHTLPVTVLGVTRTVYAGTAMMNGSGLGRTLLDLATTADSQ